MSNMIRISAVLLALVFVATESFAAKPAQPNFVFILVDDLGYMDVSPNNPDTFYETPNIQKLADTGMRFTDGYAACPVVARRGPAF